MAELRLIVEKAKTSRTTNLVKFIGGEAPQASPMISDPKFGRMNSALDTVPNSLIASSMACSKTHSLERI